MTPRETQITAQGAAHPLADAHCIYPKHAMRPLTDADRVELIRLEEAMWRSETRFDADFQQRHFAADFMEYGRSGRVYTREQVILSTPQPIRCQLPLPHLALRLLDGDTVLITYDSIVTADDGHVQHNHRTSIWSPSPQGWVMRFHQGTPFDPG